jgi:hypothetical protein
MSFIPAGTDLDVKLVNLFVYLVAPSSTSPDLRIDDNNSPPKVELVGGARRSFSS